MEFADDLQEFGLTDVFGHCPIACGEEDRGYAV
jgi:hypothetical protein